MVFITKILLLKIVQVVNNSYYSMTDKSYIF